MLRSIYLFTAAAAWVALALPAAAQDSTITYQGQLQESDQPFTGTANLQFYLFDQLTGGSQVGPTESRTNWPVEDGLFKVELDFGAAAFNDQPLYLEVHVNDTPLTPRQLITATPYALQALGVASGAVGANSVNSSEVQLRVIGTCPGGQSIQVIDQSGSVTCAVNDIGWSLTGNAGLNPTTNFIGTTDDQPLIF